MSMRRRKREKAGLGHVEETENCGFIKETTKVTDKEGMKIVKWTKEQQKGYMVENSMSREVYE